MFGKLTNVCASIAYWARGAMWARPLAVEVEVSGLVLVGELEASVILADYYFWGRCWS